MTSFLTRSIIAQTEHEMTTEQVITALLQSENTLKEHIQSVFRIQQNRFVISMTEKASRLNLLKELNWCLETPSGKISLNIPTEEITKITVRAVPAELSDENMIKTFKLFNCGVIKRVERQHHKGFAYKIENGMRTVHVQNYKAGKLPAFIKLAGFFCKVFLPKEEYIPKCTKCLQTGHLSRNCTNEQKCSYCKTEGHIRNICPELKEEYPLITETQRNKRNDTRNGGKSITTKRNDETEKEPNKNSRNCVTLDENTTNEQGAIEPCLNEQDIVDQEPHCEITSSNEISEPHAITNLFMVEAMIHNHTPLEKQTKKRQRSPGSSEPSPSAIQSGKQKREDTTLNLSTSSADSIDNDEQPAVLH